ncbi:MAG: hypothetical protein J5J00_11830 [Deltaproteobacteria bacterium]|nr:hypothetical protein [Deltaproteobacteria bacterium]
MLYLDHNEAILFRVLTSFFGHDHVIPNMSVISVCGGGLPERHLMPELQALFENGEAERPRNSLPNKEIRLDSMPAKLGLAGTRSEMLPSSPCRVTRWAKENKCLFTIVNGSGDPRMVIEFFSGFGESVTVSDVEHQHYLRPILRAAGITYCTISIEEFAEITDPGSSLDFFSFLKAKCEALGMTL